MVSLNIRNPGAAQAPAAGGGLSPSDASRAEAVKTSRQDVGVMAICITKAVEEFRPMELFKVGNAFTAVLGISQGCLTAAIPNSSSGDYYRGPADTGSSELREAFKQECKRIVANGKYTFA